MKHISPFEKIFLWFTLLVKGLFSDEEEIKPKKGKARKKRPVKKPVKQQKKKKLAGKSKEEIFTFLKKQENPIILPNRESKWENLQTFNPGTVFLDDKIHFLYRAMGDDYYSRLGYANSSDGFSIDERLPYPVYELGKSMFCSNYRSPASGGGIGGCEDPRIVKMDEDDRLYVTYTDFTSGRIRMAITSIDIEYFLNKRWEWNKASLISAPNQAHKNWVVFPEKIKGKFAVLHSISPRIQIEYLDDLNFRNGKHIASSYQRAFSEDGWDYWIRGAGPPPLRTNDGWLLFYHAMSKDDFSKYKVGAMLLDLKDPTKVLYKSKYPILIPEECYENEGYKPGVVYVSGAVIKGKDIILHYGGADSYVCAAHANLENFLESLKKDNIINLKKGNTKKYDIKKI
ncbi:MAG: hypothetical protein PHW52_05215 [Candidatus Pacebacteria bacterium]|nr:hypothetical protein [Candidatus Paceibacterota bacterium]